MRESFKRHQLNAVGRLYWIEQTNIKSHLQFFHQSPHMLLYECDL